MNRRVLSAAVIALVVLTFGDVSATTYGKKKKGLKGRYLVVDDGVDITKYRGAIVILETTTVQSDKNKPVDIEMIRTATDEMLRKRLAVLKSSGVFDRVVSTAPLELPDGIPVLRLQPSIQVQHGSQAMRVFVGMGAGRSKTHIRIEIFDARTGEHLAYFNGYGSGSGSWTFTGGNTARMAQDDVEESFDLFSDYIRQAIPNTIAVMNAPD